MQVVFLGPPGAGKGTQAAFACEEFKLEHISTGDLLRAELKSGSEIGNALKTYIEAGDLVPDELIVQMVQERLKKEDCQNGFLLDGFPRTVPQANALNEFVNLDVVINIDVPAEKLADRIANRRVCRKCSATYTISELGDSMQCQRCEGEVYQRADDQYETVMNRLQVFEKQTAPLVDYYQSNGLLINIDGDRSVDEVREDIFEAVRNQS